MRLEDFPDEIKKRFLRTAGLETEARAKELAPVRTGRLRSSITHKVEGDAVSVGTNVEYARYVEDAKPFLRPAAFRTEKRVAEILKKAIRQ